MPSLQKPRKIGVEANNGDSYYFLCKPKDDLRKDARLMDFNSVVNKLLQANSESRRRQLRECQYHEHERRTTRCVQTYGRIVLSR